METQMPSCCLFLRCEQNTTLPTLLSIPHRTGRVDAKRQKNDGSNYYEKDKSEKGKSKEKTDGWSKARRKNEQFAIVLKSKREDGVECT